MQDIHAIRPPVVVGIDPMIINGLIALIGGIILSFTIYILIKKWLRNKADKKQLKTLPPPLPAYETALKELDLLGRQLNDHPRMVYFSLTLILRQYISRTFDIHGAEMTSQEFIRHIKPLDMNQTNQHQVVQFLNLSDPIKYAGVMPQADKIQDDLSHVKKVIDQIEVDKVEADRVEADRLEMNKIETSNDAGLKKELEAT